ncbi:MAG: hypothetical protein R3C28_31915 [Pirellulaceae bacterium]
MRSKNTFWLLCVPIAVTLLHSFATAQEVLYDNLDNVRPYEQDSWLTPLGPDVKYAQQFFLGDQTNIDQVTVLLTRPQAGTTGDVRFELWRDDGNGRPMPVGDPTGKIADLGSVLKIENTVPVGEFGAFTLDNLVLGLEPNQPYWIVTDHSAVRGIAGGERSVGIATPYGGDPRFPDPPGYEPTAGTNGAGFLRGYQGSNDPWLDLTDFFGLSHFYQALKIEAMSDDAAEPTLTKVGEPIWTVGDIHHFSAGAGSDAGFRATVDKVSPPSTHCTPRDLPHDDLWADSIVNAGFTESATFVPSEIDGVPNGVYTTVRLLPDPGETGSSLDAESGPIIPVELLEIGATWSWSRNGNILDSFSGNFARPDCLINGFDGLSSFQQISEIDASFFPPGTELVGSYATELQVRDSQGNGWDVSMPFEVVDEIAGDIRFDGQLDATDIDMLSSAIRQSLSDPDFDQNGDGQVNLDDRTHWVHDLANTYFGDSNLDGEFNSSDMTLVFSAAEYEDNITLNSTWAEGDWNGDGDFDSSDLILAFQDGGYEQGPRADVQAVPEPTSVSFALLSLPFAIARLRRPQNRL